MKKIFKDNLWIFLCFILLLGFARFIYSKSFKEAQSIVTPLNIAIIVPAAIGLTPGMELNKITALIPILNVSLATKEMLSGSINWNLLSEVYASLIVLAGFSLWFCVKWFNREETIFRN